MIFSTTPLRVLNENNSHTDSGQPPRYLIKMLNENHSQTDKSRDLKNENDLHLHLVVQADK